MRKNYKFILGVIVGAIIFTTIGVYAATQIISSQVTYKDNKSVQDAIDDLYGKIDIKTATILYSDEGQSGGSTNINYINKSYTLTDQDISNNYKCYILEILIMGSMNNSYGGCDWSTYRIGSNYIILHENSGALSPQDKPDTNIVYWTYSYAFPKLNTKQEMFNITCRGVYSIKLIGVK